MNVKNETARILRAHAERAASANAWGKIYFKLYNYKKMWVFLTTENDITIKSNLYKAVIVELYFKTIRIMLRLVIRENESN